MEPLSADGTWAMEEAVPAADRRLSPAGNYRFIVVCLLGGRVVMRELALRRGNNRTPAPFDSRPTAGAILRT
jgi:hypothetical protein